MLSRTTRLPQEPKNKKLFAQPILRQRPTGRVDTDRFIMHTCIDYWHPCIYMHAVIHDSCMRAPRLRSYTLPETPKFIRQRPFTSGNAHTVSTYRVYSHTCRFAFSRAQACNRQWVQGRQRGRAHLVLPKNQKKFVGQ